MDLEKAAQLASADLVVPFEGYHRKLADGSCSAYPDPGTGALPWTIGFGSTGPDVKSDTQWTRAQAEGRLTADLKLVTGFVLRSLPANCGINERRLAALLSFVYNVGPGNFRISSVRRYAALNQWGLAAESILLWNKAGGRVLKGLTIRRRAESRYLL